MSVFNLKNVPGMPNNIKGNTMEEYEKKLKQLKTLMYAFENDYETLVDIMINSINEGCQINFRVQVEDNNNYFHLGTENNKINDLKLLIKNSSNLLKYSVFYAIKNTGDHFTEKWAEDLDKYYEKVKLEEMLPKYFNPNYKPNKI